MPVSSGAQSLINDDVSSFVETEFVVAVSQLSASFNCTNGTSFAERQAFSCTARSVFTGNSYRCWYIVHWISPVEATCCYKSLEPPLRQWRSSWQQSLTP